MVCVKCVPLDKHDCPEIASSVAAAKAKLAAANPAVVKPKVQSL